MIKNIPGNIKMINQIEAMHDTLLLMVDRMESHKYRIPTQESLTPEHLVEMYETAEEFWDAGKLGRWLGWMQAAICSMDLATLDDFKAINKKWHIEEIFENPLD